MLKYWHYVVIVLLVIAFLAFYIKQENKIHALELDKVNVEKKALEESLKAVTKQAELQQEISERYQKHTQELTDALKNISIQSSINTAELRSLHTITSSNKANISTATRDSLIPYTETLTELFEECSTMVTDLATKADEASVAADTYYTLLEDVRTTLKKTEEDALEEDPNIELVKTEVK